MKSKIKNKNQESEYPCLKESTSKDGTIVVMFIKKDTGVVIWSSRESQPVGYYLHNWLEGNFNLSNEKIELSND